MTAQKTAPAAASGPAAPAILPPGVSASDFAGAIREFITILGAENVLTDADHLAPYTKVMVAESEDLHRPAAVIMARTVEQVQKIMAVCNRVRVPIWPISTGRNFGYGSAAPQSAGQVILDLRHMNRILEVDPVMCTALVEPGVTYQQLKDYLVENNIPLWLSCPAPSAIAGPLGNTVDRGVGYTPYGEHFMMQCGMEVVLADGQVLRTGMGGVQNTNAWQVFKWGYGPYLDGIFTQSNYGVVTKMGMWLMPQPPVYKPFSIRYEKDEDIHDIVETLRPLRIAGVIPNAMVFANVMWEAAAIMPRSKYYQGTGTTPDHVLEEIKAKEGIGAWNVYAALYGTKEQVEVNWNIITGAIKASGKGRIITEEEAGETEPFKYRAKLMRGDMTLQEFGLYRWRGGGGSMWFAPVTVAKGSETRDQTELAKKILGEFGLDYVAEYIVGMRDMHHIIDVLFDRSNPEEMERAHACFAKLLSEFGKRGYAVYRVNTAFMDQTADLYGPVKRHVDQALKRALDPNGIIAPGKSGIRI
ncbi:MAG: 4-cresol dehydrogenase [Novosphingobium sp. 63-713]|uniref:FAD-binding oxidoreductase n=1 Tax=unclassified Novosphingobium TaxID=2644732 RepID=UPI000968D17D|nr:MULTISPECIES: FAD-binding oxidoreductase [unclassified Novosphingobium]MDR6708818.1 4-cresol dehydrogenase (hydroxylating) [Novosphingobium sp. 1748]OJX96581.1 MAG: 4-cresol dehydrogenase [Novosphingobium sp. 63-713]